MADVESNINVNIDTSSALASIKRLQAEISTFHQQMAKGGATAAASSAQLQQGLVNSVNATGNFSASMRTISSATESFTNSLEKNKFSMGEYFRYAGASTKTFGRLFSSEFNTIDKVARERVKDLQTQYIKLGRDANGAMRSIAIRPLTLDMNDLGTKTAMAAQKQQIFNQLMSQGSTNLLNFGKNTQWAGRQLMVGFTVPLTIMGAAAAREFKNIEEQVVKFKRVYGDAMTSTAETDAMANNLKTLAREFTQYGISVANTMKLAADAAAMGKTGADLTAQVTQASRLSALGGVDQQKALETTTSLTSTFGIATKDLANNIDFLNSVENQTITSIEDLTTAIPTAAPVIQQLGGNVKDLAFFLTAMREGGINASEGANALKSGLASMINPTTQATAMLQSFGINLQGIMDKDKGNVKQMVIDLGAALNSLDPTNRAQAIEQMFGKFQFARMSTLFQNVTKDGTQASRVLELSAKSATELAIISERELKRVSDSPLYKFEKSIEDFKASLAPVGEAFLKAITPIIEWGKKVLDWFNSWNDQAKNIGVVLTIAIAGLGPILLMAFGLISNGAANIIKMFMGLRNMFLKAGGSSKVLGEQLSYMSQEQLQAATVAASLDQAHNKLIQTFTSESSAVGQLIAQYQAAVVAQNRFMSASGGVGGKRKASVKKADGGIVFGEGTATSDSIPAMLSNGEAVIPAKHVAANRGLVQSLISGNLPGYATGGIVSVPKYAFGGIFGAMGRGSMAQGRDGFYNPSMNQMVGKSYFQDLGLFDMRRKQKYALAQMQKLRAMKSNKSSINKMLDLFNDKDSRFAVKKGEVLSVPIGKGQFLPGTQSFLEMTPKQQDEQIAKIKAALAQDAEIQKSTRSRWTEAMRKDPKLRGWMYQNRRYKALGEKTDANLFKEKIKVVEKTEKDYPGFVDKLTSENLAPGERALLETQLMRHRADSLIKKAKHPGKVETRMGRSAGPGTYFTPTPADSLDFEGDTAAIFGTSMHKIRLSKEAQQRIKNSKGYLTQASLSNFVKKHPEFKGIFEEAGRSLNDVPWNSDLIQSLIKEGYVGFNNKRYGEMTNWLVGTPGFDLEATPYASGGIVKGPGTGTSDSIPAMLSSGEAVIPAKAVRENPKLVEGLIAGNIPGFVKGGRVGPTTGRVTGGEFEQRAYSPLAMMGPGNTATGPGIDLDWLKTSEEAKAAWAGVLKSGVMFEREVSVSQRNYEAFSQELGDVTDELLTIYRTGITDDVTDVAQVGQKTYPKIIAHIDKLEAEGRVTAENATALRVATRKLVAATEQDLTDVGVRRVEMGKNKKGETIVTRDANERSANKKDPIKRATALEYARRGLTQRGDVSFAHLTDSSKRTTYTEPKVSARNTPEEQELARKLRNREKLRVGQVIEAPEVNSNVSTKKAKAAGAKAIKEQKDAFVEGAVEEGGVASPAKVPKKVGAAHSEGFTEGAKEGIAKAKTVGKAIADRNVNTNPAFGRVPQMPPVATVGMRDFISQRSAKMTRSVIEAQMSQMGGMKILTATEVKLRDATKMLAGSKIPLEALTTAAQKTKAGLDSAAIAVKDFSVNAATKLSDSIKSVALRTKEAAINIGNTAINAPGTMGNWWNGGQKNPEIDAEGNKVYGGMRGKIIQGGTKFGNKIAGAGMGIGMAAMMTQGMGGPVGDIAGQLSGPIMAISSIASIFQMFPGILAAMTGPIGLVVAGLAAAGIGLKMMYDQLIATREAAKQAAEATAITTSKMNAYAEAAGTVSPTEIRQRQRQTELTGLKPSETQTFGDTFFQGDSGKKMQSEFENAISGAGKSKAINELGNQLATAVATGMLTAVDASQIATSLGQSLKDQSIGIGVNAKIVSLIGSEGKDITNSPMDVHVKLISDTASQIQTSMSIIKNTGQAGWGSSEWNSMVAAEQQAAIGYQSLVNQSQLLIDNLDVEHQKRLDSLQAVEDLAGIEAENATYQNQRTTALQANNKAIQDQVDSMKQLNIQNQNAIVAASRDALKTQFTGTQNEGAAKNVQEKLNATRVIYRDGYGKELTAEQANKPGQNATPDTVQALSNATQLTLSTNIQAGNIDVVQFEKLTKFMDPGGDGNQATYDAIANITSTLGGPAAGELTQLLGNFGPGQEKVVRTLALEVQADPSKLDTYTKLVTNSKNGEGAALIGRSKETDKSGKATSAAKKAQAQIDKATKAYKAIDNMAAKGPITMEIVAKTAGFEDAKFDANWFNGLPAEAKKFALQYFVSVSASVTDDQLTAWMKSHKIATNTSTGSGRLGNARTTGYTHSLMQQYVGQYAADQTQQITNSLNASGAFGGGDGGNYDSSGGGGGGSQQEAPRTITDVIADQQKRITAINDQTTAVRKLVAAGLSLADAYAIASNAEDAALIANGANAAQLAELTAKTREAEKATKDLAAATNAASAALDIKEKNDLAAKLAADNTLTDIQKRFLLENADAARLYMNPTFDQATLNKALLDAQNASTYEFNIKKVTIPGLQDIWKKGLDNAMQAFSAQQNAIEIKFKVQSNPFKDIVEAGKRAIEDIQNKPGGLDDLDADLQRISNKEFEINKAYDEKIKALDEVSKINDRIIAQQKSQIGLAEALTQGDIAAAAKAAQDMRSQDATSSLADQKNLLDQGRKSEIDSLTGTSGLTRDQIEEKIRDLKAQVLEIEEQRIEPAQRQMELLDRMQQDQIDALTVLGKTKDEWDAINTSLELANTKTKEFQDAMREALSIATTLGNALATGVVPAVGSMPTPAPAPAPAPVADYHTEEYRNNMAMRVRQGEFGNGAARVTALGADYQWIQDRVNDMIYHWHGYSNGGIVSYMNNGGMIKNYLAKGGFPNMPKKGTDTIPAMLTAGEFVMSKPAVDSYGASNLARINNGGIGSEAKIINNSSDPVYNYNISVTAGAGSSPNDIAQTVVKQIRDIDYQRVKGNRF